MCIVSVLLSAGMHVDVRQCKVACICMCIVAQCSVGKGAATQVHVMQSVGRTIEQRGVDVE